MSVENCGNCRHYHAQLAQPAGECHRNPPQLLAMPLPGGQIKLTGAFPPTKPTNVCGEHSVKIIAATGAA